MPRDHKKNPSTMLVLDSDSEQDAIRIAEKMAQKLRKAIVVRDANGRQIWIAEPDTKTLQ